MGGTCAVWCCLASCLDCHVFSLFCVFFTPFSRERACGASHGVDTMRCECDNDWRAGGNGHLQSAFFVLSCFSGDKLWLSARLAFGVLSWPARASQASALLVVEKP